MGIERIKKDVFTAVINSLCDKGFTHEAEDEMVMEIRRIIRDNTEVIVEIDEPTEQDKRERRLSLRAHVQWKGDQ